MYQIETSLNSPKNTQPSPRNTPRNPRMIHTTKSHRSFTRNTSQKTIIRQPEWLTLALDSLPLKLRRELRKLLDSLQNKIVMLEFELQKLQCHLRTQVENLEIKLKQSQLTSRQLSSEFFEKEKVNSCKSEFLQFMENNASHTKNQNILKKIRGFETKGRQEKQTSQMSIAKIQNQNKMLMSQIATLQNHLRQTKSIEIRNVILQQSPQKQTQRYSLFKRQFNSPPQSKSKFQRRSSILKPPSQRPKLLSPDQSQQFGKEKVIEKKRVRMLLQQFVKANGQDQAIDNLMKLAEQIGFSTSQAQQLCAYI